MNKLYQNIMLDKRKCLLPFLILVSLIISSCQQIAGTDGIPYTEQLVVSGFILNGLPIDSILFTKTLPIQEVYDKKNAELTDVKATIETDGKVFNLVHNGNGYYKADLVPEVGKRYKLNAEWNGKSVTAETFIPDSAVVVKQTKKIDSVFMEKSNFYYVTSIFDFELKTTKGTFSSVKVTDSLFPGYNYSAWDDTLSNGNQFVKVAFPVSDENLTRKIFPVQITSYDLAYFNYLQSTRRGGGSSPFGTAPPPVRWNIKGDGIGLFIGAVSIKKDLEFQ